MKKLILVILLVSILIQLNFKDYNISIASTSQYARIESTTPIYKTTSGSDKIDNIFCLAEETYYIEIIGDYTEYYRVMYNSIIGYVKKTDVKEISNTPSTPYPYNIKITIGSNCNLRSSPTTNSNINNVITTLYTNENEITFIGRAIGEEAIDFGGSTWYYVNYQGHYGYLYNNYVKNITPIYPNEETFTYLTNQLDKIDNPITHTPSLFIIILLLIPLMGMLILLYLPKKKQSKKITKPTQILERF